MHRSFPVTTGIWTLRMSMPIPVDVQTLTSEHNSHTLANTPSECHFLVLGF